MIKINLLPGAASRRRKRFGGGASLAASFSGIAASVKDPFLAGASVAVLVSVGVIGMLYTTQSASAETLVEREQRAVQDSTRYAAVIAERRNTVAQRDSVVTQLEIIAAIDNNRYVWPHLLDEVSRNLPSYTWLMSLTQTSAAPVPPGADAPPEQSGAKAEAKDTAHVEANTKFRLVGHTVDIQALTRFMKLLEASPFIRDVQLARTDLAVTAGKQVTEFQLDAQYEVPPPSALRMVPVTLSVR